MPVEPRRSARAAQRHIRFSTTRHKTLRMKEPLPFQPYWVAFRGGVRAEGRGLLPGPKDTVEKFVVHCGNYAITVEPKKGLVWLDSRLVMSEVPGDLVWKRRMQFQMHTHDHNTKGLASCLCYIVGVSGRGYKLFEDGRILQGVN